MAPWLTKLAYTTITTTTIAAGSVALERSPSAIDSDSPLNGAASAVVAAVRFTRSLYTATHVILDYRRLFARHTDYDSDEYRMDRSVVHERCADRLLKLARTQGGVYVKIGQHVASMNHVVPREYSNRLKLLEDRAAHRPFWQIERTIRRQLGIQALSQAFSEFDSTPVAAASLAQVHRAILRSSDGGHGEQVAVKVQYPGLETLVVSDLATIRILSRLLKYNFSFFNMDWAVAQFRRNLNQELDFAQETRNAERTSNIFSKDKRICVPRVYKRLSTKQLLVMEYVEGCRIDDVSKLSALNIDADSVAKTVVDAFAKMIFIDGFVHCDPHGGNLLVRKSATKAGFEVCILDHGLYREMDDDFRQGYCLLWKGLILRRQNDLSNACVKLGVPGLEELLSIMVLNRPWKSARQIGTDVRVRMTRQEMRELRKDMRRKGMKGEDIAEMVQKMPDDLLLVFKMNSLVRNVNKSLGARIDRLKVNARFAVRGLRVRRNRHKQNSGRGDDYDEVVVASAGEHEGLATWVTDWISTALWQTSMLMDRLAVEVQLLALDVAREFLSWWVYLSNGPGIENQSDMLEDMKTG